MKRRDWGTTLVLAIDFLAAMTAIIIAKVYLTLDLGGFLLLSGITIGLALVVAALIRASPRN